MRLNLIAYMLIPGVHTEAAERIYAIDSDWVAPPLWRSEFASVLVNSVRTAMLKQTHADAAWAKAPALLVAEQEPDLLTAMHLAVKLNISAYDAQYVALAQDLGTIVVTADRTLARRCPDLAASMQRFVDAR